MSARAPLLDAKAQRSAVEVHARASAGFEAKLAETQALLIRAAAEFAPLTQAALQMETSS